MSLLEDKMGDRASWPKGITCWTEGRTLKLSIPFTWLLPEAAGMARQRSMLWDRVQVGGPAVRLMPGYFDSIPWVQEGNSEAGVLQRVNRWATRTTEGCPNSCRFCAVPSLEGSFRELPDWPNLPILLDNNLLACSRAHFDRVIDRLKKYDSERYRIEAINRRAIRRGNPPLMELPMIDFNQGLDARLLTKHHAERLARLRRPIIRLALDHPGMRDEWERAFELLRGAGLAKKAIRSYALIGFNSGPSEAWDRCRWVELHGVKVLPMWFHALDTLVANTVTEEQRALGWSDYERRRIMQFYYQHKKARRAR